MSNHQECRPGTGIALSCRTDDGAEASHDSSKPVTAGGKWSVSASPSFMTSAQCMDSLLRTHMMHADARASPQCRVSGFWRRQIEAQQKASLSACIPRHTCFLLSPRHTDSHATTRMCTGQRVCERAGETARGNGEHTVPQTRWA